MREILFRGKRLDTGEWVEGFYYANPALERRLYGERHWITSDENGLSYEVDPSTVGQFTGLPDKNGKRIFEGDRVVYPDSTSYGGYDDYNDGVVDYDVEAMRFYFTGRWSVEMEDFDVVDGMMVDVEVIGNIHDPELLEEGE